MSYILDALKRADAERERGHVPGLRTQTINASAADKTLGAGRPWLTWLGVALAGLALLAAASAWWMSGSQNNEATESASALSTLPAPTMAEATGTQGPVSPTPNEPAPAAAPEAPALPILSPALPRAKPPRAPATATASGANSGTAPEAGAKPAPPKPAGSTAPDAALPPAAPVRSFGELSSAERARLPAINVSGSTYSKNPALRMLIVNGKVALEGDEVAPGLKLETIEPRTAVLNHQGLRYRIGY